MHNTKKCRRTSECYSRNQICYVDSSIMTIRTGKRKRKTMKNCWSFLLEYKHNAVINCQKRTRHKHDKNVSDTITNCLEQWVTYLCYCSYRWEILFSIISKTTYLCQWFFSCYSFSHRIEDGNSWNNRDCQGNLIQKNVSFFHKANGVEWSRRRSLISYIFRILSLIWIRLWQIPFINDDS